MPEQSILETVLHALPAGYLMLEESGQVCFVSERFQLGCDGPLPALGSMLDPQQLPPELRPLLAARQAHSLSLPRNGILLEWLLTPLGSQCLISVREDRQAFRTLVDNSPDIITRYDRQLRCSYVNNTLARFSALPPAEHIGRSLDERQIPQQMKDAIRHNAQCVLASGKAQRFVCELSRPDQFRVFESRLLPELDDNGQIQSLLCIDRDISDLHATRQWEADENRLLEMIANDRPLTEVMVWTCQMIESQLSGALCSIMLLDETSRQLHMLAAPSLDDSYKAAIEGLRIGPDVGSCGSAAALGEPVIVSDISSDRRWAGYTGLAARHGLGACWSQPILAQDGKVLGTFALYHRQICTPEKHELDILRRTSHLMAIAIQQEQRAAALYRLATQDELTGLANRRYFMEHAARHFRQAHAGHAPLSLLMLDLDHFKLVNDNHGHEGGDVVLQAFALCLKNALRATDLVCRMGGEEFAALLPGTTPAEAQDIACQLARAVAALDISHQQRQIPITVSIGVASLNTDSSELSELIRRADQALYQAKAEGRNRVCCAP